jgi:AcrR family transcriptional regulator
LAVSTAWAMVASTGLQALVRDGFVVRSEDAADRRVTKMVATPEGEKAADEWLRAYQDAAEELFSALSRARWHHDGARRHRVGPITADGARAGDRRLGAAARGCATYRMRMPRAAAAASTPPLETESTRDGILRTAGRVFLAHGYEQSSMDEIALEAGVARRTLYNHFVSKKALFDATMTRLWEGMPIDTIIDAAVATGPAEEVLYGIGRAIADFWAPPEAVAFLRLLIWESPRFPELGHGLMDHGRPPARRAVNRYMHRLSRERGFRVDDPDLATTQFIDVIVGEILLKRLVATTTEPVDEARRDYLVRAAVDLFLARYRR